MNPRGQLADGGLTGLGQKLAVSGLDQEEMRDGPVLHIYSSLAMFKKCVGGLDRKSLRRLGAGEIQGKFGDVVVCGKQARRDEAL